MELGDRRDEGRREFRVERGTRGTRGGHVQLLRGSGFRVWLVSSGPLAINLSVFMLNRRV